MLHKRCSTTNILEGHALNFYSFKLTVRPRLNLLTAALAHFLLAHLQVSEVALAAWREPVQAQGVCALQLFGALREELLARSWLRLVVSPSLDVGAHSLVFVVNQKVHCVPLVAVELVHHRLCVQLDIVVEPESEEDDVRELHLGQIIVWTSHGSLYVLHV